MKKWMYFTLTSFATILFNGYLSAQNADPADSVSRITKSGNTGNNFQGRFFADENKNCVCDKFENRGSNPRGMNFIDENGNQVCDRFKKGTRRGNGKGKGGQYGNKSGQGNGFNRYNSSGNGFKHRNCRKGVSN